MSKSGEYPHWFYCEGNCGPNYQCEPGQCISVHMHPGIFEGEEVDADRALEYLEVDYFPGDPCAVINTLNMNPVDWDDLDGPKKREMTSTFLTLDDARLLLEVLKATVELMEDAYEDDE